VAFFTIVNSSRAGDDRDFPTQPRGYVRPAARWRVAPAGVAQHAEG
jgi:hypothetical protein